MKKQQISIKHGVSTEKLEKTNKELMLEIKERDKIEIELKKERDNLKTYFDAALNQEEEIIRLQDIIKKLGGTY